MKAKLAAASAKSHQLWRKANESIVALNGVMWPMAAWQHQ